MDYTDDAERAWGTTDGAFWWELEPKEGLPSKSCSFWSSIGDREKWNVLPSCSLLSALHLPMVSPISWSQRPKGPGSVVPWDGEQGRAGKSTDWQETGTFNKVYKTEIVWSNLSPHPSDMFHNTNTHTHILTSIFSAYVYLISLLNVCPSQGKSARWIILKSYVEWQLTLQFSVGT